MDTDRIAVETPLGTIIASPATDPNHPGISIDLRRLGYNGELNLGLVEFADDEGDFPEGKGHIITRVWGNGRQEDYTRRVVHEGIEDFFLSEEPDDHEKYIVLCTPTQALGMIADLGNGPATEAGDRTSQYFTIAKGMQHLEKKVSVALIENISGLAEDRRYYTLHLIDDVNGTPCKLYHTAGFSELSLMALLKEILDGLEQGVLIYKFTQRAEQ